jgi:hypothetical protein
MTYGKISAAAFALLAIFAFAPAAKADPIPLSPELKAFLLRPAEQSTVTGIMRHQWDEIMPSCPEAKLKQSNVLITEAPTFDKSGAPTSGSWRVVGPVEGCGQSRTFNILYLFTKNGLQKIGLLPGDTRADVTLQRDGLMYAYTGMVKIAPANCKDVKYLDTKFIGQGEKMPNIPAGRDPHAWTEEWTLRACGVTGVVTMTFAPDPTGTTISAAIDKTRRLK